MGHAVVRTAKAVRGTVRSRKSESSCEDHWPCHGGTPDPYLEVFFFNFVYFGGSWIFIVQWTERVKMLKSSKK